MRPESYVKYSGITKSFVADYHGKRKEFDDRDEAVEWVRDLIFQELAFWDAVFSMPVSMPVSIPSREDERKEEREV